MTNNHPSNRFEKVASWKPDEEPAASRYPSITLGCLKTLGNSDPRWRWMAGDWEVSQDTPHSDLVKKVLLMPRCTSASLRTPRLAIVVHDVITSPYSSHHPIQPHHTLLSDSSPHSIPIHQSYWRMRLISNPNEAPTILDNARGSVHHSTVHRSVPLCIIHWTVRSPHHLNTYFGFVLF